MVPSFQTTSLLAVSSTTELCSSYLRSKCQTFKDLIPTQCEHMQGAQNNVTSQK